MANTLYTTHEVQTLPAHPAPITRRYRGFSTISRSTENFSLFDFELIKQDLLNHFYVRQGERLMNPAFGTIIWDVIFEPLTNEIQNLILQNVNEIFSSDPRVRAKSIVITPYDTGLQIQCTLEYLLYNIQESMKLTFDQNNGLTRQ